MSDEIIIIKKRRPSGNAGHHGGSWKIAFADFMTAMMALFLLLWLVQITSKEQKEGIASFFNPMTMEETTSASDGILAGKALDDDGADTERFPEGKKSELESPDKEQHDAVAQMTAQKAELDNLKEVAAAKAAKIAEDNEILTDVMEDLRKRLSTAVDMELLAESIIIEITDEGLRIQITDRDKIPMFPVGSTGMTSSATAIVNAIGAAVVDIPNNIAITGHTDGLAYKDKSGFDNFDLSSGRANSARRILMGAGVNVDRIRRVEGLADRDHLINEEPNDSRNRRISVTLLRSN